MKLMSKGKARPIGYVSPGGFVKTNKGWRKASAEGKQSVSKEPRPSSATSKVAAPSIGEINKLKKKLDESVYQLRREMQSPHAEPSERQRALYSKRRALLRSVPKTYTPDEEKVKWYQSVRDVLKIRKSKENKMNLVVLLKGKKLPEGTVRTHGNKRVVKRSGKWVPAVLRNGKWIPADEGKEKKKAPAAKLSGGETVEHGGQKWIVGKVEGDRAFIHQGIGGKSRTVPVGELKVTKGPVTRTAPTTKASIARAQPEAAAAEIPAKIKGRVDDAINGMIEDAKQAAADEGKPKAWRTWFDTEDVADAAMEELGDEGLLPASEDKEAELAELILGYVKRKLETK